MSIRAKKDVTGTWKNLLYLVTEDDIMGVIIHWPSDWLTLSSEAVGISKAAEVETGKTTAATEAMKDKEKEAQKDSKKEKEA